MPERPPDSIIAGRVEQNILGLDSVSILPCVAAQFLAGLNRLELTPGSLAEMIESEPALTFNLLCEAQKQGIGLSVAGGSVAHLATELSIRRIRDIILSARLHDDTRQQNNIEFRRQLTRHCLAVACISRHIAALLSPPIEADLAYLAGLLHDIGKFALADAMPKSAERLLEEAGAKQASAAEVERENLGLDHTITGKRLAQKLHLPSEIILGIWLHHSNTGAISKAAPQARIAQLVELADALTRELRIGDSGSYDEPTASSQLAEQLGLKAEQLEEVRNQLPQAVQQRTERIGLDAPVSWPTYCQVVTETAQKLATEAAALSQQTDRLESSSRNIEFLTELLPQITAAMSPAAAAACVAISWKKHFQTGPVCLYLTAEGHTAMIEAALVEDSGSIKQLALEASEDKPIVPENLAGGFVVAEPEDNLDWLFEQLDVRFDRAATRLIPLTQQVNIIGVIVFEPALPLPTEMLAEKFRPTAEIAASLLGPALAVHRQQWFAERFAQLLTTPAGKPAKEPEARKWVLDALAEMAAGAAHELNNPLSVIAGRAQLLANSEADDDKKRILEQIRQNADELSAIIDDLMSYANPAQPRPARTSVKQIIDEATQLTVLHGKLDKLDIETDVADDIKDVFVDSAQIASTVANILNNALESYDEGIGPIRLAAANEPAGKTIKLQITDKGRGMDADTLAKATQPFFSARPAGRKRGMGLAHAQRLIEVNGGSIEITSQPGIGTTVTSLLPC